MVTRERFELSRDQFMKALQRLHEAAAMQETPIVRDALIQRFEFSHTYDEAKAVAVAQFVRQSALSAFDELARKISVL